MEGHGPGSPYSVTDSVCALWRLLSGTFGNLDWAALYLLLAMSPAGCGHLDKPSIEKISQMRRRKIEQC
jgi:hypothetical protein